MYTAAVEGGGSPLQTGPLKVKVEAGHGTDLNHPRGEALPLLPTKAVTPS